ncbi:LLM class flavin-dependent oxidoreductase [Glaciihabitans arcticus]|uniref:LLM class flavin-dependent oxidoreductase n=1 Tax=Glaciihabitans arcticus TaxID=2668039 RepID=A0A4Q9GR45_9MICO|nr:LLM class flavin-dependent oxidoreductase [Glaciihabitans arcticus]TBN56514.1 LLM class flavin-dependent oxidoreductase [Glaciihabitans arcticus]
MPDYRHTLQFGTFITPSNAAPDQTVELAVIAEELGFDLVTFQDHPYQPGFLDTWTLLSWVAARTSTIHVSGNVLNLAMRPPAVLARAAASLDLLSGGRFDLGLGAGGFWDAIDSMGGTKLTPGQGVSALDEAIDVIRGIWDADERRPLRIEGEYYHLRGAKRGPAPAHDIPIWLGALKPRMLRLTGTKADGWLPSLAYLQPGDLESSNAAIDEAARAAGREPREVRRLLNVGGQFAARNGGMLDGPAEQWVEQLTPLALEHGFATFILASDDPAVMQRFAEEVAPALREAVAAERGAGEEVRSAASIALRREGIDYAGIPESLRAGAVEPGDFGFARVKSNYMRGGNPGIVLRPSSTAEVVEALEYARRHPSHALGIRSGGHGISGRSTNDGGIVIDLKKLNGIEVIGDRLVRVGAGARWTDVANALEPHGWALSSGDYGGVGVGGLATAGGIGWLVREHGLTIDHLRAVEVVLADGTVTRASEDENPDLFWAMRGAGGNFGVATSFEFEVDEVGLVAFAQLAFQLDDTAEFLESWGALVQGSPRDLTSFLMMGGASNIAQVLTLVDSSDPDTVLERLQPMAELAPLVQQSVQMQSYASVMANVQGGPHRGQGEPLSRSGLIERFDSGVARAAGELIASGASHFFSVRSMGGAVADVAPDATAFAHRSAGFSVVALGSNAAQLDAAWAPLREHFLGSYLSFETGQTAEDLASAFPPATLARLRSLKERYDPANLFRDNFPIAMSHTDGS